MRREADENCCPRRSVPPRSELRSGTSWPGFGVSGHNSCCKSRQLVETPNLKVESPTFLHAIWPSAATWAFSLGFTCDVFSARRDHCRGRTRVSVVGALHYIPGLERKSIG